MPEDDKPKSVEQNAWNLYRLETAHLRGKRYEETEPWAWAALQARLGKLRVKRKAAA